jgi:beta-glucosidase
MSQDSPALPAANAPGASKNEKMIAIDVENVLRHLTLEEKAALATGTGFGSTTPIQRLGVPSITLSDGPHGVRRQPAGDHLGIGGSYPATCFPPATSLGSSWDSELVRRVGEALGREAKALDVQVLLGPGINIKRSPLCGRNFEYLSEDPRIAGALGAALIEGVQSQGVGTSLKHFAANNQETDRLRVSADVDVRALREIYLAGFERAVKQAAPETVMCSYNRINGVYASENHWLLTEVLRGEWGFDGLVVSDWGAVNDRAAGVAAGLDLEMPDSGGVGPAVVVAAVNDGRLSTEDLDAAVRNVLELVAKHAGDVLEAEPVLPTDLAETHHALAREVAARCAVLLKNEGGILPIEPAASIAVIGEFARTPRYQGAGSSQIVPTRLDSALDELRRLSTGPVACAPGYVASGRPSATSAGETDAAAALLSEAVQTARGAEIVVVFLGLPDSAESEGYDRTHIDLPAEQLAVLNAVADANPNVVIVLSNGSAVRVSDWEGRAAGILEGWLLGQAGGGAIADLLFGFANPSGHLAETIPVRLEDTSSYLSFPGAFGHVEYTEGVFVGYRWYDARELPVSYPFGHGLSYTSFEYSDLRTAVRGSDDDLEIDVTVRVVNTGAVDGREVVQLYIAAPSTQVQRPQRELRGFASVPLTAGESRDVTLTLGRRDLAYFHPRLNAWHVESGQVGIHVGRSSRDLRLSATIAVQVSEPAEALDRDSTIGDWMSHPRGGRILDELMKQSVGEGEAAGLMSNPDAFEMVKSMPLVRIGRFPGVGFPEEKLDELLARANGALVE